MNTKTVLLAAIAVIALGAALLGVGVRPNAYAAPEGGRNGRLIDLGTVKTDAQGAFNTALTDVSACIGSGPYAPLTVYLEFPGLSGPAQVAGVGMPNGVVTGVSPDGTALYLNPSVPPIPGLGVPIAPVAGQPGRLAVTAGVGALQAAPFERFGGVLQTVPASTPIVGQSVKVQAWCQHGADRGH